MERAQDIIKSAFQKIARQPADFISEKVDTFTAGSKTNQERFLVDDPRLSSLLGTAAPNNGTAISPWTVVVAEISSLFDRFVLEIQTDLNAFFKGAKPHVKDATSSAQFFPDAGRDSVFEQDAADLRRTFADSGVVALRSYGLGLGQLLEVHKNRALESLNNSSDMAESGLAFAIFFPSACHLMCFPFS